MVKEIKTQISKRKASIYLSFLITGAMIGIFLGATFNENYKIVSPIVKRQPIISPISKKTSMIQVAHAEAPSDNSGLDPAKFQASSVEEPNLKTLVLSYFPANERASADELIFRESSWNVYAINPTSGACGLGQALPCSKMGCDDLSNIKCQASFISTYIAQRYGTAQKALAFHTANGYY